MSEKINCGKCGMLLYFGEEIARRLYMRALPNEKAVYASYDDKCPRCGNPLSDDSVNITIKRRRTA
jgi:ribosomal protein S27AE